MAVTVALALSACATTDKISPVKAMTKQAATSSAETITQDQSVMSQPEMIAQNETLLYGAMTKFELMNFVEAVTNANLSAALETEAPLTVFAPNNEAIERAQTGVGNVSAALLKGHIIPGALDAAALAEAVQQNGGPVTYTSLAGTKLTVYVMGDKVKISGPNNTLATVAQADMIQSNGVMHQVNSLIK